MTNSKDDHIFTYNDTNRHGLASGIISALMLTAACICPFLGDITYWLASLPLAFIGACAGAYGIWQSKFNSKNKFPKKLCIAATVLNALFIAVMIVLFIIGIIGLCVTGGR
ncbi:MAG: hypothetical protein J5685_08435 [Clostridiales bacterium]|nr:hypothetical protein [Clostridiales bacterium]